MWEQQLTALASRLIEVMFTKLGCGSIKVKGVCTCMKLGEALGPYSRLSGELPSLLQKQLIWNDVCIRLHLIAICVVRQEISSRLIGFLTDLKRC